MNEVKMMKKLLSFMAILFLLFVFSGCNNNKLAKVENIRFDGQLIWDEVENADNYLLVINNKEYELEENYFPVIEQGEYQITICAKAEDYQDSVEATFTFTLDYDNEAEVVLSVNGDNVSWNEIDQVSHYILVLNEEIIRLDNNYYEETLPNQYSMYVYGVYPDGSTTLDSITISIE